MSEPLLTQMTLAEAMEAQFRLVDTVTTVFQGSELMTRGDLGVVRGTGKPKTTAKVESVLARFFNAEKSMLVRGSGTAAIRMALTAAVKPGGNLLIHGAPVYPTTATSIAGLGLQTIVADFNTPATVETALKHHPDLDAVLIQVTRQQPTDRYVLSEVISLIKTFNSDITVITDDNYAVMRVKEIGCQQGAELSCFSLFKLLGPEGIGCIVGKQGLIDPLISSHYSGGSQVQGHEALDALNGLIYAPVSLAIQSNVGDAIAERLQRSEIPGIRRVLQVNAQSKVLLVEFEEDIAEAVLAEAELLGAAPHPIGAESKYEFVPLFYRVSDTFLKSDPSLNKRMIRINPMRSGEETVLRILREAVRRIKTRG